MEIDVRIFYPEPPAFAELDPGRAVYVGDADGRCEVFAWDAATGIARQVTDRPHGTVTCAIDPSGREVWWFDDDLTGVGRWRTVPFDGAGPDTPAGVPAGRAAGLAMAAGGAAAVGVLDDGFTVYLRRDGTVDVLARTAGYASLVDLSGSGRLVALSGQPDAPDAVTVIDTDTGRATVLSGVERQLWTSGFAPDSGPERLLLTYESGAGYRLGVWTAADGMTELDWCEFDTEISPSWYPDGQRVLVRQNRHGRSLLHRVDPRSRERTALATPPGTILGAAVQPDGDLHYVWTDATHPPQLRTASGRRLPGAVQGGSQPGRRAEVWADGPGGPVHALLTLPDGHGPHPAVFLLHGGPFDAAQDAYDPLASVFAGAGFTVVRPNYRGSTGYGAAWRGDFGAGVGITQLQDVAAVRDELVASGVVDPDYLAVCGESWGGYLALLAAGTQPDRWHAVAAVNPVADYPAAFRHTTDAVRALDIRLFGGTPDERPAAYARSSPATYAADVLAPVLIVAGTDDARCPAAQIRSYVDTMRAHGRTVQLDWTESGHEGYQASVHVQTLVSVVRFVDTALCDRHIAVTGAPPTPVRQGN